MRRLHLSVSKIDTKYRIIDKWDKKPYVLDGFEVDFGGFATKTPAELVKRLWKRYTLDKKNLPATLKGFDAFLARRLGPETLGFADLKDKIASRMDPVAAALARAPVSDEPLSPEELVSLTGSGEGPGKPHNVLKAELAARMAYKAPKVSEARVVAPTPEKSTVEAAGALSAKVLKKRVVK